MKQANEIKHSYIPPELTMVEFAVEMGINESELEVTDYGLKVAREEALRIYFGARQNQTDNRMGGQMNTGYFSDGYFGYTNGDGTTSYF